jgi:hypothetical protein
LLAAPRRIEKVVGLIRDEREGGGLDVWAVVQGPPHRAVRFHPELDPEQVCPDQPDEPVWVWLLESADGLVIVGKITPPVALLAGEGLDRELSFEGIVEEGGHDDLE